MPQFARTRGWRYLDEAGSPLLNERKLDVLLWLVAIGFLMQTLDSTIVNTALLSIARSFGENPLNMQAVVFSYSLMMAVMIPTSGWLSDKFGTQKIYFLAICIFVAASLLCAVSDNFGFLVCARSIQGVGGSMLLPVGRLAVLRNFPGKKFLPAISFVAIPGLVGPLLGPTLGGWLCETLSWRWIFLINVPIGILGAAASIFYMPNNKLRDVGRFDLPGYVLLAISMFTLFGGIGGVNVVFSFRIAALLVMFSLALLCFYINHAKSADNPIFNLRLLRVRSFAVGLSGNMFSRIGIGAVPYLLPLMMQTNLGYSPIRSGMLLLPSSIAGILVKRPATALILRYGYKKVLMINTIMAGISITALELISGNSSIWEICALLAFSGAANSIQFTSMNTFTLKDLPERGAGSGNSILSMIQMLSLSVSVVVAGLVLNTFQRILGAEDLSGAFHCTFIFMGVTTLISSVIYRKC